MSKATQNGISAKPLSEIARFIRGITFKPEDKVEPGTDGSAVCMRTKNVQVDLDESDLIAVPHEFVRREEQYLRESDILVSTANSWQLVGKCSWVPKLAYEATAGGFISILRANDGHVHPRYLYYWFSSAPTQHSARHCGRQTTNISNMSYERCLTLQIPLPPPPEQKRIADILDKADAIRRKRQEADGLLDCIGPALYQERFGDPVANRRGWDVVPFGELFSVSPNYGTMIKPSDTTGDWLDLRVANIQDGKLTLRDRKYVDLPEKMVERHEVREGDLLLARAIGSLEHLGKCIIAHPGSEKWAFDSHLMRVRFKPDRILPRFVHAFLVTPGGRHEFLRNSRRSAVQFNINTKEMAKIHIPLPPLPKQQEFIGELDRINALSLQQAAATREIDDLFNSLVQRAFKGEL